ncbi:transcription-repair coupling factor [Pelagibius sp. Alg239-R121]|uniref:transcription-repair coupling factor n=1 Tax=Pelagibius sp. Alg239-R121 TaxID=2993448 RepID=UPI002AC34A99|nr:transcription-repair coupling factor [Pelagibius sp. Alg239-R121]
MAKMESVLAFFAPEVEIRSFPAWDCLPYDRVSPHRDILARRIDVLTDLATGTKAATGAKGPPRVIVTTVNALMQRVPPRTTFADRLKEITPGARIETAELLSFLSSNGYFRTETVGEAGEFAIRGGILDVFPTGEEQPVRLDFFGDELESIRQFDPLTQLTTGRLERVVLKPVGEITLTPDAVERFRSGYRETFGAVSRDDPLYESVSDGRVHPGMEHWLPLFHDRLETLLDYLSDPVVLLDHQAAEARDARLEAIDDFYGARKAMVSVRDAGGAPYKPLNPAHLYLTTDEWDKGLSALRGGIFTPYDLPDDLDGILDAGAKAGENFAEARAKDDTNVFDAVRQFILQEQSAGRRVIVAAYSDGARDRLSSLLREHGQAGLAAAESWADAGNLDRSSVGLITLEIDHGFTTPDFTLITEQDILGERIGRQQRKRRRSENFLTEVSTLQALDLVVHVDHGIGRYEGLETIEVGGAPHDCLKVIYHGGDKLFVPVENIEVLSRFGSEDASVELDRLGGAGWQSRKAKVKQRIKAIADELIKIAAARAMKTADSLVPQEGIYDEFAARFPFPETEDQLRAIEDILDDLGSGKPMDRLVCGDVGFGKTEVALRAAFIAVMAGKQVAVVVPTTLLARQHYKTFSERFTGLPVNVVQLSRLVTSKDASDARAGLEKGTVEIVIGTHALLGKSVRFRDLGLLIVDEEQHFGVKQKERLKQIREDVHVLTLTATPIPRTLQLAMSGVKEMSLIATPPVDRLAVRTFVLPYDPVIVREAILREHYRGGQTFYVCPRLADIAELKERLAKLVPEVKIAVAHGQLPPSELEAVMTAFYDHQYDVLLSTNIIESGLDIPSANTMIVHRADMFGLAQLYQIRGRIGRSKTRGYAYLTLPPGRLLSTAAEKRLNVMQTLDSLGAGFTLASHDMDIRGAGNLLGEEQSGHIREVGIELYQQMLEEAVAVAKSGGRAEEADEAKGWTPQINVGTSVLIPERYVTDLNVRLGLYRRLSELVTRNEIEGFAAELIDRFGDLPEEVENLLDIMTIKQLCRDAGVIKVDSGPKGAVVAFHNDQFANPAKLIGYIQSQAGIVNLRPDHKLVYKRAWSDAKARVKGVRMMLDSLVKLATG